MVKSEAVMPAAGRRGAVPVVDDDADNREVVREVLSEQGYAVSCARDGAEALAKPIKLAQLLSILNRYAQVT